MIFLHILLLAVGFTLLVKGADWFVDGASGLARKFGIPQLVIGLTIVAMGTSIPEAAVSITAALKENADIAVGNVVGSNILNILIILGLASVIAPLTVRKSTFKVEIPFMVMITVVFVLLGRSGKGISKSEGIVLWVLFLIYLAYLFVLAKNSKEEKQEVEKRTFKLLFYIFAGAVVVVAGSDITVDSATEIAKILGVGERFIGLTIVALGTSLPELVTSVVAARKGNADIAVGNIVGSNIFNILFDILKCNRSKFLFHCTLYSVQLVIHNQVNISSDWTLHIRILMKMKQFPIPDTFHRTVHIQKCDIL